MGRGPLKYKLVRVPGVEIGYAGLRTRLKKSHLRIFIGESQ